jgi:GH24 family phage-related lysozyme (muramidase)
LDALGQACGVKGSAASALVPRLAHLDIPFSEALTVFTDVSVANYTRLAVRSLPNTAALHPDSLGALVSLVYNRGASFQRTGDRYREMRGIHASVQAQDYAHIPAQIRGMKRIWAGDPNSAGLLKRRELEARLFEQGLAQS